jgi:hypothetical protein
VPPVRLLNVTMDLTQIVVQMRGNMHVVHELFTNQRESQEAHAKLMSAYNAVSGSPYFKPLLTLLGQVYQCSLAHKPSLMLPALRQGL